MHHERFIELVEVQRRAVAQFYVDHRCHGKGGQHLVRRLDGEEKGPVGHVVGHVHGETSAVNGVEFRIGIPGLVEVDAGHAARQFSVSIR